MHKTTVGLVAILLVSSHLLNSAEDEVKHLKEGNLESSLGILNLFGKKPDSLIELYSQAYGVLSEKRTTTYFELSENDAFKKLCSQQALTHLAGPMLGSISAHSARVWVRTLAPALVTVKLHVDGEEKTFGPVASSLASDLSAVVEITGLKAQTRYSYQVFIDGKMIAIPDTAAIVTCPENDAAGKMSIVFGSCPHRWGLGNTNLLRFMRERNPTALLLLGDIAVQDRDNHLGLHRADYLLRDFQPAWRELVSTIPVYASWDDHDYFGNDKAGIPNGFTKEDKMGVCDVFKLAWNNPSYGFNDERRGIFLKTRIGPCDIIMTDNRYFRENKKGSFLGDEQMRWFEQELQTCKGPFVILSCGTMWSDYVSNGKDSWGKCDPEGRKRIFDLIKRNNIGGVIFISGDRHGARSFRIPQSPNVDFYEFEAASLGGRAGPPIKMPAWTTALHGIDNVYAFGELSFDTTKSDPEVTYRLVDELGKAKFEITLKRSQLMP